MRRFSVLAVVLLYAKPAESLTGICSSRRLRMADCIPDENTESVRAFVCDAWTLGVSIPLPPACEAGALPYDLSALSPTQTSTHHTYTTRARLRDRAYCRHIHIIYNTRKCQRLQCWSDRSVDCRCCIQNRNRSGSMQSTTWSYLFF